MSKTILQLCFLAFLSMFPLSGHAEDKNEPHPPIKVVASFSIIADIVKQIGGEDVEIVSLVGPNEDAHSFRPSAEQAKLLAKADIIAINGLHFEGWIGRLIKASGTKAKLMVVSAGVRPLSGHAHHHHEEEHGHEIDHGEPVIDPHAWQDLSNGKLYAKNIAAALIEARPNNAETFKTRLRMYLEKLDHLDTMAKDLFASLPNNKKKIITTHDAFSYFSRAYGIGFIAAKGSNLHAEASAGEIAHLIKQIKEENIHALFVENMADDRLLKQIAKQTNIQIGGTLYTDALSQPDGEAPTYLQMMGSNIRKIALSLGLDAEKIKL